MKDALLAGRVLSQPSGQKQPHTEDTLNEKARGTDRKLFSILALLFPRSSQAAASRWTRIPLVFFFFSSLR